MRKRTLPLALILLVAFSLLGARDPSARFDKLGHKLMCTCGCAEMLLECNHVGCPDSPGLIAALHAHVDAGETDAGIFKYFETTYGATVLASPLRGGFDNVAWVVPFALLVLGIAGVLLLLRYWRRRYAQPQPAAAEPPGTDALRDRIRNETNYGG